MREYSFDVAAVIVAVILGLLVYFGAFTACGQQLGVVQRIYSNEITNKAWSIDKVFVRSVDGTLYDPTGTYVKHADLEYLKAVNDGMGEVLTSGSNAFRTAEAEFLTALSNTPPLKAVRVQMITSPHSDLAPTERIPYGLLVKEEGRDLNWFLSSPFGLKPNIVRRLVTVDGNGHQVTNFEPCVWTDYKNDVTGAVTHAVGDYPRTIRMQDPTLPSGITVIRNSHLHWGHPNGGIDWGGMEIAFADVQGNVRYPLTGVYTAEVNSVKYEFRLKCGSSLDVVEVE